ncbi:MFS family permease [Microbacterium sp. AK031]|nr:MFS family permease [Microbacterium sp. AK031]
MATSHTEISPARQRRSMVGAFVGTAIEWYDFYIFGTAAALVFGRVFYPDVAPGAALLASFTTFWVGFLMRPVGGLVFGHFGDKLGRKNVLVITLVLMGVATTLIGLLPTFAQIGMLAPILLVVLRGLQGFAVGGEWGGAVLLSTENARPEKKGLAGAWVQQGSPAGSILATLMFLLVGLLPDEQFISWGWRIPFLVSAILVAVGLVIRLKVEESPDFVAAKQKQEVVSAPVLVALRTAPIFIGLGVLASVMGISNAYFSNTFLLSWTTGSLGLDRQLMLNILLGMAVLQFIWQPIAAKIAERFGIARVMLTGLVFSVLLTVPYFLAIQAGIPSVDSRHALRHDPRQHGLLRAAGHIPGVGLPRPHSVLGCLTRLPVVRHGVRRFDPAGRAVDPELQRRQRLGGRGVLRRDDPRHDRRRVGSAASDRAAGGAGERGLTCISTRSSPTPASAPSTPSGRSRTASARWAAASSVSTTTCMAWMPTASSISAGSRCSPDSTTRTITSR